MYNCISLANIAMNTAKVANTIEGAATCKRNRFSEIKMRCLDVPIMMKSVLLVLSLSLFFVIQPGKSLRQSPSCLRERSVFGVDKDMYTWVSSAYK